MDVKRIIRERRLQEATEEIRRTQASAPHDSAQSQREFAARRVSRQVSARSSRPSSQFGDAESPPEWYENEERNQAHFFSSFFWKCAPRGLGARWWEPPGALSSRVGSGRKTPEKRELR